MITTKTIKTAFFLCCLLSMMLLAVDDAILANQAEIDKLKKDIEDLKALLNQQGATIQLYCHRKFRPLSKTRLRMSSLCNSGYFDAKIYNHRISIDLKTSNNPTPAPTPQRSDRRRMDLTSDSYAATYAET